MIEEHPRAGRDFSMVGCGWWRSRWWAAYRPVLVADLTDASRWIPNRAKQSRRSNRHRGREAAFRSRTYDAHPAPALSGCVSSEFRAGSHPEEGVAVVVV